MRNPRRNRFRSSSRGYRRNGSNGYSNHSTSFGSVTQQKSIHFSRNNQNASKMLEKYTNLAKEALSTGDKILSENYLQHADHFSRLVSSRNAAQKIATDKESTEIKDDKIENNPEKENTSI